MRKQSAGRKKEMSQHPKLVTVTEIEQGYPVLEPFSQYSQTYALHIWTYACVKAIMNNAAAVEINPYIQKGEEWISNEGHPFKKLLANPNPYMSGYSLRQCIYGFLALCGNAYLYMERMKGTDVKELWPLISDKVTAVPSKEKLIDHYELATSTGKEILNYSDIIHFKSFNPDNLIYGQGSTAPVRNTIATDLFAQVWNKSFFSNNATPYGVLETDSNLDDGTRTRLRQQWKELYQGPDKTGKTAILEAGLKYKKISEAIKDMDFVNLRKEMRIEILGAFGVPPALVGVLEYANYSNMTEQKKIFWTETLVPQIKSVEEMLTLRIAQETGDKKSVFEGDYSAVEALRENAEVIARTAKIYIDAGFPPNMVIEALNLPFEQFEGGDQPRPAQGIQGQIAQIQLSLKELKAQGTVIQTLIFSKDKFSKEEAIKWISDHGFKNNGVDESENGYLFKQRESSDFDPDGFGEGQQYKTINLTDGVKAVIGFLIKGIGLEDFDRTREVSREAEWKRLDGAVIKHEKKLEFSMRSYFRGQNIRVLKAVEKHRQVILSQAKSVKKIEDVIDMIFDTITEEKLMNLASHKIIKGTFFDFAIRTLDRIKPGLDFSLDDPVANDWIEQKVFKLVRKATETTREQLTEAIVEGVQEAVISGFTEGETLKQIVERINDVHDFAMEGRSKTIARTETHSASNAGSQSAMEKAGIEKKEWLAQRGDWENVRDSHKDADGQVVDIKDSFRMMTGAMLRFPGDGDGPPEEIINCRCKAVPFREE